MPDTVEVVLTVQGTGAPTDLNVVFDPSCPAQALLEAVADSTGIDLSASKLLVSRTGEVVDGALAAGELGLLQGDRLVVAGGSAIKHDLLALALVRTAGSGPDRVVLAGGGPLRVGRSVAGANVLRITDDPSVSTASMPPC